ncbi:type I-E CRISPR-associated protein Cas6/Cse3/CasE [Methanofollis formosanus]|nr:type I-E CRISPR-associated protein Cas6/Cse3/CasE [Methanofollis formosanus]
MTRSIYRIRLRDDVQRTPAFWRSVRNPYDVHGMVWRIFSDGARKDRDFIYRLEMQESSPVIYAVSTADPVDLDGIWAIEQKEYSPVLRTGQRLGFSLRANPIRAKRNEEGKQKRCDVVMDAKTVLKESGCSPDAMPSQPVLVQKEGFSWLASRGEAAGFAVDEGMVRAEGYRQHRFKKPRGKNWISISTIDFTGVLTVTDPDRFEEALYGGIGPAKSFGCGLVLIRPV